MYGGVHLIFDNIIVMDIATFYRVLYNSHVEKPVSYFIYFPCNKNDMA